MAPLSLPELLEHRATVHPDRDAIVCGSRRLSWSELYAQARQLVSQLAALDTPLAILAQPRPSTVVWVWAALLARRTFSMLDPTMPARVQRHQLEQFGAAHLAEADHLQSLTPSSAVAGDPAIASVLYTSGSSGEAKGVAMTAEAMAASVDSICAYLSLDVVDRIWGGLPLHYGYGLYQSFLSAASGATLVLPRHTSLVGETLRLLRDERISVLPGVPALWDQLLAAAGFTATRLTELRTLTNAGEHLPTLDIVRLRERFPHLQIHAMYGLTEYSRVASLDPDEIDDFPKSVGRPIRGCQVRIVDETGESLGPGKIGELVVRGPHRMAAYWRDRSATQQCLRRLPNRDEVWLHTGDLFEQDPDGRLYHRGRCDDVFKCRGQKVSPARVREVLESHPAIEQAMVIPHRAGGCTEVIALLRNSHPVNSKDLRRHCHQLLAAHEIPSRFEIVRDFPRNARGKLDKDAAMKLVAIPERDS